jgi:hypothetical protein
MDRNLDGAAAEAKRSHGPTTALSASWTAIQGIQETDVHSSGTAEGTVRIRICDQSAR